MVIDIQRWIRTDGPGVTRRTRLAYGSPVIALRLNRAGWSTLYIPGVHVARVRSIAACREGPRLMCNRAVPSDIGPN